MRVEENCRHARIEMSKISKVLAVALQLREEIEALGAEMVDLRAENDELRAELDAAFDPNDQTKFCLSIFQQRFV